MKPPVQKNHHELKIHSKGGRNKKPIWFTTCRETKADKPSGGKTKCLNNDNLKNEGVSLDIHTHTHTHT